MIRFIFLPYFKLVYTMQDGIHAQNGQLPKVSDEAEEITSMQSMKNNLEKSCQVLREKHMIPYENRSWSPLTADLPARVMISEDFKLIGCKLLKVGSTNIRRLLYTLDNLNTLNDTNESDKIESRNWHIDIRLLKGKRLSELRHKLKKHTKNSHHV